MTQSHKLSLPAAIFININIMLGTGVFINTVVLAQKVGALGPLLYAAAGLLMFPLALSMARLMDRYEQGSFYNFGSALSPYWGFISTWSYFVGKIATPTLGIHVFNQFLQNTISYLQNYSVLTLDACVICFFVALNLFSGKVGKRIQYTFLITKALPLFFAIIIGFWYFDYLVIASPELIWEGVPLAFPLIMFCFLGFEATCSLSKVIENPQQNASKAILYSFFIVVTLLMLYQFFFYATLGSALGLQGSWVHAFPAFIQKTVPHLLPVLGPLLSLSIATSALGGAYGIMYSNAWNLHTLAQRNYLPASSWFATCNAFHIPALCILTEGLLCFVYLFLTKGAQIPLQYTSVLSCMTSYAISVASLNKISRTPMSMLAIVSCLICITVCVNGFIFTNIIPFCFYLSILAVGTLLYFSKRSSAQL